MTRKIYTLLLFLYTLAVSVGAQERYTRQSLLATGKWMKIRVKDEGVYQLSPTALKNMGFSNAAKVRLYGYNMPMLPEAKIENIADDMMEIPVYRKSNGTILFYSCGTTEWKKSSSGKYFTHKNNPYSSYIYYFLTESDAAPATFSTEDGTATTSTVQDTYLAHSIYEDDAFSFLNAGRTFFEKYDYADGASKTYRIPLDNTTKGDVILDVRFGANGSSSSTVNVSSGSNSLGNITIGGVSTSDHCVAKVSSRQFTIYDQTISQMPVTLKHTRSQGTSGHLDYIRLSYQALLTVGSKNYVVFSPNSKTKRTFAVAGADNGTCVWNVTSPSATHEIKGTLTNGTYKVSVDAGNINDKYVAVNTNSTFPAPQQIGKIANQNLHALDSINLLIIVPANGRLTDQALRLAQAHTQKDGMKCAVVKADEVYNEFSAGTPDATAYRRLMKMLYDRQYKQSPLRGTEAGSLNLLLFGNCFWDNRLITTGLTKLSQDDYLLAYESDDSWSNTKSYVMEEYYTLLEDGKGVSPLKEKPDCGVGRLPVTTAAQAKNMVDKLIGYIFNIYGGGWKNNICMMADDGNANIHMQDAENILDKTQSLMPEYHYQRIYWDSYQREQTTTGSSYPGAYADINKTMEEGALIMNYTGHGAPYTLSHEQVLKTADFQNWSSPRLPLWFTAACDVAPFDMNTTNIACEAMLNKNGAAMGFISTARTVYSPQNRTINRNFMSHVLARKPNGENYTIGEALAQAKADIAGTLKSTSSEIDSINKVHFILLGDPAIKLCPPKYNVKIDRFNGLDTSSGDMPNISAGDIVTVEGRIVDEDGNDIDDFNGILSSSVYDSEEHIVCKNNANEDVTKFEYDDRTRVIYSGSDSIRSGKFTFSFPVTIDINYSDNTGMLYLHAINQKKTDEAHGIFDKFTVGGSNTENVTDTIGPSILAFCDGYTTKDSVTTYTTENPTLRIVLSDDSGINTTGSGLGHDIVAIIDGKESMTYSLNSYYTPDAGSYKTGSISYTLPSLPAGTHTLLVRAFDTLNNMGESFYTFEVVEGMRQEYDIIDMSGRVLQHGKDISSLKPGVYIRRIRLTSPAGTIYTKAEKFAVTQ